MAGAANSTAGGNAFFGHSAGAANTTADGNAFFGHSSGAANTIGFGNSFFGSAAGAANTGAALDPTGALSLQDAVRRQLGIRLEETKRPVPVLVIDSISEKPLEN